VNIAISTVDCVVVIVYVVLTLLLGLWIGRGASSLAGFLVGGRDLPWYAVLGSIIATETSAVTFLSIPGVVYAANGNFSFLQLAIGFVLGRFIVIAWLMPRFFRGEILTAYDVLHQRFGGLTQRTASLIFMGTRTIADGLRLFLTGLVLDRVTGLDTSVCILLMGVATIVYSSLGGIKSVVWNDCIQLIIYLVGALVAIAVMVFALPGGFQEIVAHGQAEDKFRIFNWLFSLRTENAWSGILGGCFLCLATHGTDQMMVQRYLCSRNEAQARLALGVSGPLIFLQFAIFLFVGVGLAAYYQAGLGTPASTKDQVFAQFIVQDMPVGVCGITLAAVFSVAMSTLSSSLSGSASAIVNDFMKPAAEAKLKDRNDTQEVLLLDQKLTRASQLWTAIFGVMQIGVAVAVANLPMLQGGSIVNHVITVAGFASGLILGVFFLGQFQRKFDQRSLIVGMIAGFALTFFLVLAPDLLYEKAANCPWKVHGWWAAIIASFTTCAVAYSVDVGIKK
jgi:solute:Na+ symporter, SSS family